MVSTTVFSQRVTDHHARIAHVNRQGWMRDAARPATGRTPVRRRIRAAIVRVGEWLRGAPTGRLADRAAR
jgi:hypothetical protein